MQYQKSRLEINHNFVSKTIKSYYFKVMNIFFIPNTFKTLIILYLVHHHRVFFCPVVQQQFTERQIVNDGSNMKAGPASIVWSVHCIRGVLPLKQVLYHILKNEIYAISWNVCIESENPYWSQTYGLRTFIIRDRHICNCVSIQLTATQNVQCIAIYFALTINNIY